MGEDGSSASGIATRRERTGAVLLARLSRRVPAVWLEGVGRGVARVCLVAVSLTVLAGTVVAAASAAVPDTKKMVLQLSDLPSGFTLTRGAYVTNAQEAKASFVVTMAEERRWARIMGYSSEFKRSTFDGFAAVTSIAVVYKTEQGAADRIRVDYASMSKTYVYNGVRAVFTRIPIGAKIGDEARMYSTVLHDHGLALRYYVLIWRSGRVAAIAGASGLRNAATSNPAKAVALAEKQQARIAATLK